MFQFLILFLQNMRHVADPKTLNFFFHHRIWQRTKNVRLSNSSRFRLRLFMEQRLTCDISIKSFYLKYSSDCFRIHLFMAFICILCSELGCTQLRICLYFPQYELVFPLSKLLWMTNVEIFIINIVFFLEAPRNISNYTSGNFQ